MLNFKRQTSNDSLGIEIFLSQNEDYEILKSLKFLFYNFIRSMKFQISNLTSTIIFSKFAHGSCCFDRILQERTTWEYASSARNWVKFEAIWPNLIDHYVSQYYFRTHTAKRVTTTQLKRTSCLIKKNNLSDISWYFVIWFVSLWHLSLHLLEGKHETHPKQFFSAFHSLPNQP